MKNPDIIISIIVPVYNVKEYIRECLESLISQTFNKYEIILVNDGSTDGSDLICKEYEERYENIRYYSQSNKGQSAARNLGVIKSKGIYILFVDSDDYIENDTCKILYEAAKKYDVDIVIGDILNEKERIITDTLFRAIPHENKKMTTEQYCKEAFEYNIYDIVPWIRLVKKEYLIKNKIEFLEGCYYEDHEYSMRLFTANNGTVVKIRFPFYFYRTDRAGSTTNYASPQKGEDFIHVIEKMELNMEHLNEKFLGAGLNMLGLAYYHFVCLWMRIKYKEGIRLQKSFCEIVSQSKYSSMAIECLDNEKKKRVKSILNKAFLLKMTWQIKTIIKKIR